MKNKFNFLIFPLISLLLAAGLTAYYFDRLPIPKFGQNQPKHQLIKVIDQIPIPSSYKHVKTVYPSISELQGQGGYLSAEKSVFTEAFVDANMFELPVKIKFNFDNHKLYSYYFDFKKLKKQTANKTFDKITRILTEQYGQPIKETLELNNEKTYTNFWDEEDFSTAVTISTTDGKNFHLSTGYQKQKIEPAK